MNKFLPGFTPVVRLLGHMLGGTKGVSRNTVAATLSFAETLLALVKSNMVVDFGRLKETLIRTSEAKAEIALAEAQKIRFQSSERALNGELRMREELARAEASLARAKGAKVRAEAKAVLQDAETRRLTAIREAQLKLVEAITKLREQGGEIYIDEERLTKMVGLATTLEKTHAPIDEAWPGSAPA